MGSAETGMGPPRAGGAAAADLERLWELQQVDGAIRAAREGLEGHPDRVEAESARDEAAQLEAACQSYQERLRELRMAVRRLESELAEAEREGEQLQQRLFGGAVTHPKELSSLQARLEAVRERAGRLQDETLEQMESLEQTERALAQAQQELTRARERLAQAERRWEATRRELEAELARLERQRAELVAAVANPTHLARYERLAGAKGGQALALVDQEKCSACGLPLSNLVLTEARRKERMIFCETCGRILYWRPGRHLGLPGAPAPA